MIENPKIAIVGLGYVGLPLAIEFSGSFPVIGFDIDARRIADLKNGVDKTKEANVEKLKKALSLNPSSANTNGLIFTTILEDLKPANIFIITVPTPIDRYNVPDLGPLLKASEMIGSVLKNGGIVIYESTVYPGCTEEDCVPVLEEVSGLKLNEGFFVGAY